MGNNVAGTPLTRVARASGMCDTFGFRVPDLQKWRSEAVCFELDKSVRLQTGPQTSA